MNSQRNILLLINFLLLLIIVIIFIETSFLIIVIISIIRSLLLLRRSRLAADNGFRVVIVIRELLITVLPLFILVGGLQHLGLGLIFDFRAPINEGTDFPQKHANLLFAAVILLFFLRLAFVSAQAGLVSHYPFRGAFWVFFIFVLDQLGYAVILYSPLFIVEVVEDIGFGHHKKSGDVSVEFIVFREKLDLFREFALVVVPFEVLLLQVEHEQILENNHGFGARVC